MFGLFGFQADVGFSLVLVTSGDAYIVGVRIFHSLIVRGSPRVTTTLGKFDRGDPM
jgi:hypothetical protein